MPPKTKEGSPSLAPEIEVKYVINLTDSRKRSCEQILRFLVVHSSGYLRQRGISTDIAHRARTLYIFAL